MNTYYGENTTLYIIAEWQKLTKMNNTLSLYIIVEWQKQTFLNTP